MNHLEFQFTQNEKRDRHEEIGEFGVSRTNSRAVAAEAELSVANITASTPSTIRNTNLRLDWTNLPPRSEIAKRLQNLQRNCSLPYMKYEWRPQGYGIGSDLHVWGNNLWAGLIFSHRLKSPDPWIWADLETCQGKLSWDCYFPAVEPNCPGETFKPGRIIAGTCQKLMAWPPTYEIADFRAAATEFVFSSLSDIVIREAERQRHAVFGDKGVPSNLITVHVRWGDKALEGSRKNNPIGGFIAGVEKIVEERKIDSVHILLCTEDPLAEAAFRKAALPMWTIYLDHFYTEFLPHRKDRKVVYNVPSFITMDLNGRPGLWALGSLLVAMEANYFVMTTKSNWARLMNELRKNIIDPRCDGCTFMVDLEEGEC